MKLNILKTYEDFFNKRISFIEFSETLDDYLKHVNPAELTEFFMETTDNPFMEYDPDMVMLTYIYLWMLPNRLNQLEILSSGDNMYLSFISSVLRSYELSRDCELLDNNFNYSIYKRDNLIIILNHEEFDITVKVPEILKNSTHYCINCNDSIDIETTLELYPYGFYIIEI